MENPIKMDDFGGKPTIFGNIHIMVRMIAPKFPPWLLRYLTTSFDGTVRVWEAETGSVFFLDVAKVLGCFTGLKVMGDISLLG